MGATLNRSVAADGVIAYQDFQNAHLFHYLPARIDSILKETIQEYHVTYYGIGPDPYLVDMGNGNTESVVGGILSGKATPDITGTQKAAILEAIAEHFQVDKPRLVPLELMNAKVQPIFAKSIAEMGERSNADFPAVVKFGSSFNYQVASGNSLFAELVGSTNQDPPSSAVPDFAVNISGEAEFYGDPWEATIECDLKKVWEYTWTKVNAGLSLGWLELGVKVDELTQELTQSGIVNINYIEGSGGPEFGRQLLETTKKVFEAIDAQVTSGEGFFKFEPNPEPREPKDPEKSLGASLLPWSASVNVGYTKESFAQSIEFKETVSFTGKQIVPIAASMSLAIPCSSSSEQNFYDLQTKKQGCVTRGMSAALQDRIKLERDKKNEYLKELRQSLLNGVINFETYTALKAEANTISYTESAERVVGADGSVSYRRLSPDEVRERLERRLNLMAEPVAAH